MKQLIQIESIPLKLNVKTTFARFERPSPLDMTRFSNLNSSAQADTAANAHSYDNINSLNRHNLVDVYDSRLYQEDVSYADMLSGELNGNRSVNADPAISSSEYIKAAVQSSNMNWVRRGVYSDQESLSTESMSEYLMDRANFDMNISLGIQDFEFVPASVEFTVIQRPEVRIEYLGSPNYVPPSAAPEYIDTTA